MFMLLYFCVVTSDDTPPPPTERLRKVTSDPDVTTVNLNSSNGWYTFFFNFCTLID